MLWAVDRSSQCTAFVNSSAFTKLWVGTIFLGVALAYTPPAPAVPPGRLDPMGLALTPGLMPSVDSVEFTSRLERREVDVSADEVARLTVAFEQLGLAVRGSNRFEVAWNVFSTTRAPTQMSFPHRAAVFKPAATYPVILAALTDRTAGIVAFFAVTLLRTPAGHREAVIEYIVNRSGQPFPRRIIDALRSDVAAALNIRRYHAEMKWGGRFFWADAKFKIKLADHQPRTRLNGVDIAPPALIRHVFTNFVSRRGLTAIPSRTFTRLMHPRELLLVKFDGDPRVEVEVLQERGKNIWRTLPPAQAFLRMNHDAIRNQTDFVEVNGVSYSDEAMPPWFGELAPTCQQSLVKPIPPPK